MSQEATLPAPYNGGERSDSMVYFCRMGDAIKIGSTGNGRGRFKTHQREARDWGGAFAVLAAVCGARAEEIAVQSYFDEFRMPGSAERFRLAPPLLQYIRWLRDSYYVAVGEEHPPTGMPADVPVVSFDGWRPEPHRRKEPTEPLFGEDYFGPRVLTGDDFYTPLSLIELVWKAFRGTIDLDPASHPVANRVIKAVRFFQRTDNGLNQPWEGSTWLNPPFSEWPKFAEKMLHELASGRVRELLALVSTPTLSARYLAPALERCDLLMVLTGRLEFWGPHVDNGNGAGPSSGHVLLYYGPRPDEVADVFAPVAVLFRRHR